MIVTPLGMNVLIVLLVCAIVLAIHVLVDNYRIRNLKTRIRRLHGELDYYKTRIVTKSQEK